jgi:protein TonB
MAYYQGAETPDRWKAAAGVFAVHVALAAVLVTGLNVDIVTRAVDQLQTFDIADEVPPPPVPEPPPPKPRQSSAPKQKAAPANIKSKPTPVVDPEPKTALPIPLPMNTSKVRGPEGMDRTAGASNVPGLGTGAGGQGSGFGGGGSGGFGRGAGSGVGFTPARIIGRIPHSEYRRISAGRLRQGSATISFRVTPDGRMANCRVVRSSGDSQVDWIVCDAASRYMRFSPARDANGRAISQDMSFTPTWQPNW